MSDEEQISPQSYGKSSEYKKLLCRFCKSTNVIKKATRKTKNRGKIQRYLCKDCKRRFTIDDGFLRMRNSPHKITLCLDLFFQGISTRKIQAHLKTFYEKNSNWSTVYRWIVKYSKIMSNFTDKLKLNVGNELQIDEMEYKTRGEKSWFIDCMDLKTRYIVSSEYVKHRNLNEIKNVLKKARKKVENQIRTVTTDGYIGYPKALKKSFGLKTHTYSKSRIKHRIVTARRGEGFNHKIERLHNSIRQRTVCFRGFHGTISSANAIMKGFEIYYNFVRKHQAIGKYPYELAIPELKLKENKWLDLIERGVENDR